MFKAMPQAVAMGAGEDKKNVLRLVDIHVFFTGYASRPLYNRQSMLFEAEGRDAWEEEELAQILGSDTNGNVSSCNPGS